MKLGLFIDIGYAKYAYCIGNLDNKQLLEYNCIETPASSTIEDRIYYIYEELIALYDKYGYELICLEEPCFNGKKGAYLNRVLGMNYVLVGNYNTKYLVYNPKTMKRKVTGIGTASKKEVQHSVQKLFAEVPNKLEDDVYDAIGIYTCYLIDNNLIWKI